MLRLVLRVLDTWKMAVLCAVAKLTRALVAVDSDKAVCWMNDVRELERVEIVDCIVIFSCAVAEEAISFSCATDCWVLKNVVFVLVVRI